MIQHPPLTTGQTVFTADRSRLGTVAEVSGSYLRLQRRLRRGIWLPAESILWADNERAVMAFNIGDLNRYQRRRPPAESQAETNLLRVVRVNRSPFLRADAALPGQTSLPGGTQ